MQTQLFEYIAQSSYYHRIVRFSISIIFVDSKDWNKASEHESSSRRIIQVLLSQLTNKYYWPKSSLIQLGIISEHNHFQKLLT